MRVSPLSCPRVARLLLAAEAMRTRFECVLHGPDERALRAAGEAALGEIRATERCLSRFLPDADFARLHREAPTQWCSVSAPFWEALIRCRELHAATGGAFDVAAATPPGCAAVEFDEPHRAVRFTDPGVRLDFGGIGKGIALDRAAEVLREAGVQSALLHGGTSSVLAVGAPPESRAWRVAIADPDDPARAVACVELRDAALGISARARALDPRTGAPAAGTVRLAVARAHGAADADAWATALLLLGTAPVEFREVG